MKREKIEEAITNIDDRFIEETALYTERQDAQGAGAVSGVNEANGAQGAGAVSGVNAANGAQGAAFDANGAQGVNAESGAQQANAAQGAGKEQPARKKGTLLQFFRRHYALSTVACLALAALVVFSVVRVSDKAQDSASSAYEGYAAGGYFEPEDGYFYGDNSVSESMRETAAAEPAGMKGGLVNSNSSYGTNPLIGENSKIIYNATITAESTDYDSAVSGVEELVASCGGYFEVADEYDRGSGYRSINYTIRIPAEAFEGVTQSLSEICHITRNSVRKTDISETYYDTKSRLENAQAKLDRLRELYAQAETMEDLITLEDAINMAQYDVDYYSGQIKHYDSQVAYSTIEMSLTEVYKETEVSAPLTFWDRLGESFSDGMRSFGEFWEDFSLWLVYNWTFLLFLAAIAVCIILLIRHRRRKKAKKSADSANNA